MDGEKHLSNPVSLRNESQLKRTIDFRRWSIMGYNMLYVSLLQAKASSSQVNGICLYHLMIPASLLYHVSAPT